MDRELRPRTWRELACDIPIVGFCLLRLVMLWALVVILIPGSPEMRKILKGALKSRVVLFNAGIAVLAALPQVVTSVGPLIGENKAAKIVGAIAAVNILLRAVTTKPLEQKADAP